MNSKEREFDREKIGSIIRAKDVQGAELYLKELPLSERARLLSRLNEADREQLFGLLDAEFSAEIIQSLGEAQSIEILESVDADLAARVIDLVPSDDQADLLSGVDHEVAEQILAAMSPEEAVDARELMKYPWDTAGGMMVTEYLAYRETTTVRDVADDMRSNRDRYANFDIQYVYVIDAEDRLLGVLRLRDLVLARQDERVVTLMIRNPVSVIVTAGLHDLYQLFANHSFLGLPVIGHRGELVGVLERSAVEESMSEEATENYLKVAGLQGNEELRSMALFTRSRRRLSWLSINIVLNVIAASVIAVNQDVLAKVTVLAVFLPIISDMSGCSGNQAIGVSVRELTLGLVKPKELRRVFFKELGVGLMNGFFLGLLVAAAGAIWQSNLWFGAVVGVALMLNTVVAVLIGGLVPLILKRFNMDPALASGPILTTITDMCGFFFVLFFASQILEKLV